MANQLVDVIEASPLQSSRFSSDLYPATQGDPNDNPYYNCYIICNDRSILIHASLPMEYSMDMGSQYESSFSQALSSNMYSAARSVGNAAGYQFATKAMTAKVWQGTNDITFTLPFVLQLETDYYKDILKPLSDLYKLVLPTQSKAFGLLESPGPSLDLAMLRKMVWDTLSNTSLSSAWNGLQDGVSGLIDGTKDFVSGNTPDAPDPTAALLASIKNNCSLLIGSHQYFDSVVVTNVAQTTHVLPYYKTGTMSRVEVSVTFSTFVVPTQSDISKLLLGSVRDSEVKTAPGVSVSNQTLVGPENSSALLDASTIKATRTPYEYEEFLYQSGLF
jgi:hypothetical protein